MTYAHGARISSHPSRVRQVGRPRPVGARAALDRQRQEGNCPPPSGPPSGRFERNPLRGGQGRSPSAIAPGLRPCPPRPATESLSSTALDYRLRLKPQHRLTKALQGPASLGGPCLSRPSRVRVPQAPGGASLAGGSVQRGQLPSSLDPLEMICREHKCPLRQRLTPLTTRATLSLRSALRGDCASAIWDPRNAPRSRTDRP